MNPSQEDRSAACLCEWRGDLRAGAHARCPIHGSVAQEHPHPAEETDEWVAIKIARIRERVELMRWSERLEEEPPATGSLASVFWDSDVPWLLDHAQRSEG